MNELMRKHAVLAGAGVDDGAARRPPALLRHHHDDGGVDAHRRRRRRLLRASIAGRGASAPRASRCTPPSSAGDADHRRAGRSSSCSGSRIGYRDFVRLQTPPADAMDVYVMGKQWMWKFAYPEGPNGVNVLRVPAHRPVRLLMTSRDVIHSFFVPAFRIKQDVAARAATRRPGSRRPSRAAIRSSAPRCAAPATRRCAPRSIVMEPNEFDSWFAEQTHADAAAPEGRHQDAARGSRSARDDDHAGAQARRVARAASSATPSTARRTSGRPGSTCTCAKRRCRADEIQIADEAYITESMMDPKAKQVQGYQLVMPTLPRPPRGPGVGGHRRVHQVAALGQPGADARQGPQFDIKSGQTVQPGTGSDRSAYRRNAVSAADAGCGDPRRAEELSELRDRRSSRGS